MHQARRNAEPRCCRFERGEQLPGLPHALRQAGETLGRAVGLMEPDVVAGLKAFVQQKVKETPRISIAWFGGEPLLAKNVIYDLSDSFIQSARQQGVIREWDNHKWIFVDAGCRRLLISPRS
jgi:hypothetical protein